MNQIVSITQLKEDIAKCKIKVIANEENVELH